jgi:HEAT repeat protein
MNRLAALLVLFLLAGPARAGDFEEDVVYHGRTLRDWLADINSRDAATRRQASRIMRLVGPEADEAVPALLLALRTDDMIARNRITWALARIGPKKAAVLAAALAFFDRDNNEGISYGVVRALAELGPEARPVARHLERQLGSTKPRIRILSAMALWQIDRRRTAIDALRKEFKGGTSFDWQWVSWALEQCGPGAARAAPNLVALLGSREEPVRRFALRALESIGRPAVPSLVAGLKSPEARLRVESAEALGRLGPEADAAVPDLAALMSDTSPGPRASAARALGRIGLADEKSVSALRKGVRDADRDVRLGSARALGALPQLRSPESAVSELALAVRDPSRDVRVAAGTALARIGKPAVAALVKLLADSDDLVRRQALDALRVVGPDAGAALPALETIVKDSKDFLRPRAILTLAALGKPATQTLAGLLTDIDVRIDAADALASLGPEAATARPALEKALAPGQPVPAAFRQAVLRAMAALGPAGRESAPTLIKICSAGDNATRSLAMRALVRIGAPARDLLAVLHRAIQDREDVAARLDALGLLVELGPESRPILADVARLLQDKDSRSCELAGQVLILLGQGKSVLPAVRTMLEDTDAERRQVGLTLVCWLGPQAKGLKAETARRLKDDNPDVRLAATGALLEIEPGNSAAVEVLVEMAKDPAKRAGYRAVFRLLGRAGTAARAAVPVLAGIVAKEADLGIRLEAARALGAIGAEAREAVPALFGLLLDLERMVDLRSEELSDLAFLKKLEQAPLRRADGLDDPELWEQANRALGPLRSDGDVSAFAAVLRWARQMNQADVFRALASIGPAAAVGAEKELSDDLAERRLLAARLLGLLGVRARESAPALRKALGDGNRAVAVEAAFALHRMTGDAEAVLPVLRRGLEAPGEPAESAAFGLTALGSAARPAGAALLQAVEARDPGLRRQAAFALAACRPDSKELRPALQHRLRDRSWPVRVAAALSLAKLDRDFDPTPLLVRAVAHGNSTLAALESSAALGRLGERGRPGLRALRTRLNSPSERARVASAAALLRVAGPDERIVEALIPVVRSTQVRPEVRITALEALAGVKPVPRRGLYAVARVAHDRKCPPEVRQAAHELLEEWAGR